ncbi:MAG: 1-phosphofructokinase [Clostridia bacterium]|nr:1-phosphofructokinase [Clostridia bacterium]
MIFTVTFNPAIDYVMQVGEIEFGKTNRSRSEEIFFGGKGINVSAVLSVLGENTTALGFIAGFTGDALEKAVAEMGVKADFIRIKKGNTRINVKLKGAEETEINAVGPHIEKDELNRLFEKLESLKSGDTLVLAGSIPTSLPSDIYEHIAKLIQKKGVRLVVDATGELLLNVLEYHPFLIKPNKQELEEVAKMELKTEKDIILAATDLKNMGAENVLVSLGADGAILLDTDGKIYKQSAFKVKAVNTVGAGDSMLAGFLAGVENGFDYALKLGAAAGAATAALSGLATREKIEEILSQE